MRPSVLLRRCRAARWASLVLIVLPCGAETAPPAEPLLHDGFTQEREIRAGETQGYAVELQAGQYLRVTVEEKGVDVEVRLMDPAGTLVVGADSPGLPPFQETEDLAAIALQSGSHRLLVVGQGRPISGGYLLHVEGPRMAAPADRTRAEAVQSTWKGITGPKGSEEAQLISWNRALSLWKEMGERRKTAQILYLLGRTHDRLDHYAEAAKAYLSSADEWAEQTSPQSREWEARVLRAAGVNLKKARRFDEASSCYKRALAIAQEVGDEATEGAVLGNLGSLASDQGEVRRAIDLELRGLELARKTKAYTTEATILGNLALDYQIVAENQKAAEAQEEALELARRLGDSEQEGLVHNNLAGLYSDLGDYDKALSHWQLALRLVGTDLNRKPKTLHNLGTASRHLGRNVEARQYFEQALELGRRNQDVETQTLALSNLSLLSLRQKKPDQALALSQKSLSLAKGGAREPEAFAHYVMGLAYRDLERWPEAQRELVDAEEIYRQLGHVLGEADVVLAMAQVERRSGHLDDALARVRSALGLVESARARVVSQDLRASFSAARHEFYGLLIDTLMAHGNAAEALQESERARARVLLEVLHEAETDARQGADPALVERERNLRDEINTRESRRIDLLKGERLEAANLAEAQRGIDEALEQFQEVEAKLRESSPRYAALTQPRPLSAAEIQTQVLDGKALLLEYALGETRSFLWLVSPDKIETFTLPGRERIESLARQYYELVTARNGQRSGETVPAWKARILDSDQQAGAMGAKLSRMILAPVAKQLGDRPLLIVAEGALQYIPFSALPLSASGPPLISRHEIVILPSATALAALRRELRGRKAAPRELAIFADPVFQPNDARLKRPLPGDPLRGSSIQPSALRSAPEPIAGRDTGIDTSNLRRLPSSRQEADSIAALVPPGQVLKALGFEATKAAVTGGGLDGFRKLHFATHGLLDSRHPELSGLVLSQYDAQGQKHDGVLRLSDIYDLRLDADLVTLSACRTALGKEVKGEGLIGLTRGFMYAGAARVLASLWSVEDKATAELMAKLYRGMLRERLSPAAALRKAQIEMARDPSRKSPYYWAGFSLQGEWR